jgi:hypothetical protein
MKRAIRKGLEGLPEEDRLNEAEMRSMVDMLPALRRESLKRRMRSFLDTVLKDDPAQRVSDQDVECFVEIRDAITHYGSMRDAAKKCVSREGADYLQALYEPRQRLRSLLERVVLAWLGTRLSVLDEEWQRWRS